MLDPNLKTQIRDIFKSLEADYVFDIRVRAGHPSRNELIGLLEETASCSEHIRCTIQEGDDLVFRLLKQTEDTGIRFRAIPNGHEFSSLLLAVLNADGKGKNLPDAAACKRIQALKGPISLTTYMSLSCTNCPDVVQALNVMALLNPAITHTAVDGALFTEETEKLHIQAVPAVFDGEQRLHVGRSDLGELLDKLENHFGTETDTGTPAATYEYDVLVAGGGPAGVSAAIYSARKGLKTAIIAGRIGGQVQETVGIENLISVPYTTGQALAADLRKHLENYAVDRYENRYIESAGQDGNLKVLNLKGGEKFQAPALIIATGASWRKLNIPGESDYIGRGVAFCPHCDGPFYQGKDVAVIGGGNSGIEAAIDLAGICRKVTVLEFMDTLKADTVLQEKARSLKNVEIRTSVQTLAIQGDGQTVKSLLLKDRNNGEESEFPLDGVFVQIGLAANSKSFQELVETNRIGEIPTDKSCRTSVPGVYAAGDVSDVAYKQIIISMGEGAKAALSAFEDRMLGKL